jgi:hypothetical protein
MGYLVLVGWDDEGLDTSNIKHMDDEENAQDYAQWVLYQPLEDDENYDYSYVIRVGDPEQPCLGLGYYKRNKG